MRNRWECYVIFTSSGVYRMTLQRPALRSGEFAVLLRLKVPHKFFTRAFPEATIEVPEPSIIQSEVEVVSEVSQ